MGFFDFLFGKSEEENKPKTIYDFFKIDLQNIMSYNPEFSHSEINSVGREVYYYVLPLDHLELGLFSQLIILKVAENEFNITFKSDYNSITNDLRKFIKFYTDLKGKDVAEQGYITQEEVEDTDLHRFSRFWTSLIINNNSMNESDGNIEMHLMGIKSKPAETNDSL